MFKTTTNPAMQLLAGLVGVVTALSMTIGAFAPVAAAQDSTREVCLAAQAEGINVTSGTFAALCASVLGTTTTTSTDGFGVPCTYRFTQNLTVGSRSSEVMMLQRYLNSRTETQVASVGAGSAGQETTYFGNLTRTTLANYQRLNGISPAVGYFGPVTRAEINAKIASSCGSDTGSNDSMAMAFGVPCSFQFSQRLTIGDRGVEVMNLQKMLNRVSPETRVAASGPGSLGQETSFYGGLTAAAVASLQEELNINALAVGVFGANTRAAANAAIKAECDDEETTTPTTPSTADGDLMVMGGDQPSDAFMFPGVVRLPVLAIELEAGDADVMVEGMTFEFTGRVDRDLIESVILIDEDGMIIGGDESENIDSDDEVEFNEEFEIEEGETMMVMLAVNAATYASNSTLWDNEDGDTFSFELVEVEANGDVDGLPVTGGAEIEIDSSEDEVDGATVSIDHETTTDLEIGSEEELIVTLNIESDDLNNDDDESVFVKMIRFEQEGTADLADLDNIMIEVNGDSFDGDVDGDYVVFDFGNGVEIENDENEDFELYVDVTSDADAMDTIRLQITESFDIFVETENGYGAPITVDDTDNDFPIADGTNQVTIEAGSVNLGTSSEDEAEDVAAGQNILLGQFDLEVEGEAFEVDEVVLTITVTNESTTSGDAEDLLLEDVYITYANGDEVEGASNEDAEGTGGFTTQTVEFDDVVFEVGDHEDLRIMAMINEEVGDGTTYEITGISFNGGEGADSGDTIVVGGSASFSPQEVAGSVLEISVTDGEEDETSDDVEEFVFAVLELDASDSGEDVEVTSVELQVEYVPAATAGGALTVSGDTVAAAPVDQTQTDAMEEITNCALYMDGDRVSDIEDLDEADFTGGLAEYDFQLSDVIATSEGGDATELELRCDINEGDLIEGDTFQWGITASADVDSSGVSTNTDGDDFQVIVVTQADAVRIVAADLDVQQTENFDEDKIVLDTADGVVLLEIEVEAEDGTATIDELTGTFTGDSSAITGGDIDIYTRADGDTEWNKEDELEFTGDALAAVADTVTALNIEVQEDEKLFIQFRVDIATGADDADTLEFSLTSIVLEDGGDVIGLPIDSAITTIFEAIPVIELESDNENEMNLSNIDYDIFEISVTAEGEDVELTSIAVNVKDFSNINTISADLEAFDSSSTSGTPDEEVENVSISATGVVNFVFGSPVMIDEGDTWHFVIRGDVSANSDTAILTVEIDEEGVGGALESGLVFGVPNTSSAPLLEDDITVTHTYTD